MSFHVYMNVSIEAKCFLYKQERFPTAGASSGKLENVVLLLQIAIPTVLSNNIFHSHERFPFRLIIGISTYARLNQLSQERHRCIEDLIHLISATNQIISK